MSSFKKDQIVVVTKTQKAGCGSIIVYKGAICKINSILGIDEISIYKSKRRENNYDYNYVNPTYLRKAVGNEIEAFEKGIRNIDKL